MIVAARPASTDQDKLISLALNLARKGEGRTWPNPPVGALVVRHGKIVGSGYHKRAGTPHAEVHALKEAGSAARGAITASMRPAPA